MKPAKLTAVTSRCMLPVIFDNDSLWDGCEDDAKFFDMNKRSILRFRKSFPSEWSGFEGVYPSVFVIRLASFGLRIRIGLPMERAYSLEANSDYRASEQLAELCEEIEPAKPTSGSCEINA